MEQYVSDLCFVLKHNKDITRVDVEQVIYNIPTNKIKKFIKSVEGNGLLELYSQMNVLSIKFVLRYYIDRDMTSKFLNMTLENIYVFLIKYIYGGASNDPIAVSFSAGGRVAGPSGHASNRQD